MKGGKLTAGPPSSAGEAEKNRRRGWWAERLVRLLGRLGFRIGRPRKKTEALRIKVGLKAIV
jgi:hypothetical protein